MTTCLIQAPWLAEPVSVTVTPGDAENYTIAAPDLNTALQLTWHGPSQGVARHGAETKPFYVWQNGETLHLWLQGRVYHFVLPKPAGRRAAGKGGDVLSGSGELKAPMPGTVLKILVEPCTEVASGAPLLVMESMKMEMTLTAPGAVRVKAVDCQAGQLVEMNQVLMHLEAVPS